MSAVLNIAGMFHSAESFRGDLCPWDLSDTVFRDNAFFNSPLANAAYDDFGCASSCENGQVDGTESPADCGGAYNCAGGCSPPTCTDGILNQDEVEVDCGGEICTGCGSCNDGIQNQDENDVDCGGSNCDPCCGNGVINPGEVCDDDNIDSGDGCSSACEDENECTDGSHSCDLNAACVNTVGSHNCTCATNYQDVSVGQDGSSCACAPGYGSGNGLQCSQCVVGTFSPGGTMAACVACGSGSTTSSSGTASDTSCFCAAGFYGSGSSCTDCPAGTSSAPDSATEDQCLSTGGTTETTSSFRVAVSAAVGSCPAGFPAGEACWDLEVAVTGTAPVLSALFLYGGSQVSPPVHERALPCL
eukprot:3937224-Rhodomonas_salina.1